MLYFKSIYMRVAIAVFQTLRIHKRMTARKVRIPSGGRDMEILILSPASDAPQEGRTGVMWIHGGGYITGMPEMAYISRARDLVLLGAVVVSPRYALAGQAPYPAALIDCHNALMYLKQHAHELGIRSDQIMVGGESAGGGLAAAICMYEKDIGGVNIAYQMPLYPMLDNEDTVSSRDNHAPIWNTRRNHYGWARYLGSIAPGNVPKYASPARCTDYCGLPPCYTFVSTNEPFYAETIQYIDDLRRAGVKADMDIYPGLFHAFDMLLPLLKVSKQAAAAFDRRFEYAVKHYFAPQMD